MSATSSPSSKRNLKPAPSPLETMPETPEPNPTPSTPVLSTSPQQPASLSSPTTPSSAPSNGRKRKAPGATTTMSAASSSADPPLPQPPPPPPPVEGGGEPTASPPPAKKSRTNTPWSPAEEQRLKAMRDAGNSWSEIAKTFPTRTEGSVKKHWYKDMHYAEFAEDESAALLAAIKEYEASKWKVIGQKVGKPAKACEQFARDRGWGNKI